MPFKVTGQSGANRGSHTCPWPLLDVSGSPRETPGSCSYHSHRPPQRENTADFCRPASHSISASAGRGPVARGLSATLAPPRPNAGPTDRPTHRMGKPAALMWMVSTRPQASSWLRTCGEGRWRGQQGPEAPDATPSVAPLAGSCGLP